MHSLQLLQKQELGGYNVKIIQSGNRFAVWLSCDSMPLFEKIEHFWVSWVEGKIGQAVVFSSKMTKYATRTTPTVRENGMIVGIPEAYRKWLGLRRGSAISLRYVRIDNGVGFILEVEG